MSIINFNFENNPIRVTDKNGDPWFIAKDVCDVLGLDNVSKAVMSLDDDEKSNITNSDVAQNGGRDPLIISESGLYSLVLRSRKPEAKEFKRWITHEVLPSIRKHGGYMTPEKIEEALSDPDTLIRLATNLKAERSKRIEAESKIESDRPKVLFADAVAVSQTEILVGELAKILKQNGFDVGAVRLFEILRNDGYLCKQNCIQMSLT